MLQIIIKTWGISLIDPKDIFSENDTFTIYFGETLPYIPGTNTQLTNVFFQKYNFLGEKLETITPDNDIVASNSSGEYDIAVLPNDKLVITDMGQIDYSGNSPGGRFFIIISFNI